MKSEQTENGTVDLWTAKEVSEARGDIVLIDVRTPQEHGFERIGGALLMALQEFQPQSLPGQDAKRIVLHCGSGVRSGKAAALCLAAGIERIAHLEGGLAAWKAAGQEYIGTDVATGAPKVMKKDS
ncbi:rhodanese-like domain-containing protein [Roseovarius sp. Pro17]|uniref:rhodanese-like domain-containing protein n=1 Tax=Roseovarius sp. Pro17 TaxID=3108175 RepID=UPI002D766852|nr:rhodanese-like domain-containing protein [Roseovarius sp. Pro17]